MNIKGPGMFVWQASQCAKGDPIAFARTAYNQGWTWIAPKLVNETGKVRDEDMAFIEKAADALYASDIAIVPWCYLRPGNVVQVAEMAALVCKKLNAKAFIVNAEKEFKEGTGARAAAAIFCSAFKERVDGVDLILSTFAQPSLHSAFPYDAFLSYCDGFAPQLYGSRPTMQMIEAKKLADRFKVDLIPTFRAYLGDGIEDKDFVVENLKRCHLALEEPSLGITAWNYWHWQSVETWPDALKALQFEIPQEKDSGEENNRVALLAAASRLRDEAARLELIAEAVR